MKKTVLFLLLALCWSKVDAQCWKSANYCTGIKMDGTLWKWGPNQSGQLGNGTSGDGNTTPIKIGTDTDWKQASCTEYFTAAIKNNGTLWTWGENYDGELGLGDNMTYRTVPTQVGTGTNWKTVAAGADHCLAIKTDGTLWMWGETGTAGEPILSPVQVGTDTDWEKIFAGFSYSFAIKTNGTLWAWGRNYEKVALGLGASAAEVVYTPTQIGNDTNWVAIATYNEFNPVESTNYALKSDGTLWGWGDNSLSNPLGDGTTTKRYSPVRIGSDNDWSKISHQSGIKSNGTLWGWGYGHNLGTGSTTLVSTPIQIGTETDWASLYRYGRCFEKIKTDGTFWNTGQNFDGDLGTGNYTPSLISIQILTTNCPPPVIANNDSGTALNGLSNTPVANVLINDTFNELSATLSNVTLSFVSATHSGITLNATTGAVNVDSTVPIGNYSLVYQICETASISNCDTATVTITVNPQTVNAVNDNFSSTPINYLTGDMTSSVLSNDTVNGITANTAEVIITLTNNGGITGASINPDGTIWIPAATLINTYTLQYSICLVSSPSICDTATVTVSVADPVVTTPEIVFAIRANKTVYQSELQSTGKIIIGGIFNKYNNVSAKHLMRLNTDLTQDTSFPALGTLPDPPYDFKVLSNDKIIVVGTFTSVNGTSTGKGVARLNADGTVDTSFNVGGVGIGVNDRVLSCAIQSDGKILLGGGFIRSYNGVPVRNMIRLNVDGSLDTSFVYPYTYELGTFGSIHTINVTTDDKLIVSGNYSTEPGGQVNLFQLNTDGSLDENFVKATVGQQYYRDTNYCSSCIAPIQNVVLQSDGKILVVGAFNSYLKYVRKNMARLQSNGAMDLQFAPPLANRVINDVVIEPDGKFIIAGEFTTLQGFTHAKLARLNANGTRDASFSSGSGPTHTSIPAPMPSVMDLNRQVDGKVIVSGIFSHYNGISATNITRITPEIPGGQARGTLQLWNTEPEIENSLMLADGIRIYPNPSNGIFTIDLTESKGQFTTIAVYNALGQAIYQKNTVPETVNEIDLSALPSGYYYAKMTGSSGSVQKVLLKK